jgi:transcriptional regulator of arginine metabolism
VIEALSTGPSARERRQKAISDLIRARPIASQEELTERLASLGFVVTQATVSRDLEQLGAVKVKRGGVLSYALADQLGASDWSHERLQRILTDWVLAIEAAGALLVIKTPPGSAHLVASAIDNAQAHDVAGTVSGDDTLFVAVRDGFDIKDLLARFRTLAGQA